MKEFVSRLFVILGDRKKHPWGQSLGISQSVVTTMFEGVIPSADFLSAITRIENVSLSWLVSGIGQPYLVSSFNDSDQCVREVEARLMSEKWFVSVITDKTRIALLFFRPDEILVKARRVEFTAVDVFSCSMGMAVKALERVSTEIYISDADSCTFSRLVSGQLGTYQLLRPGGLLQVELSRKPAMEVADFLPSDGSRIEEARLLKSIEISEEVLQTGSTRASDRAKVISLIYDLLTLYEPNLARKKIADFLALSALCHADN